MESVAYYDGALGAYQNEITELYEAANRMGKGRLFQWQCLLKDYKEAIERCEELERLFDLQQTRMDTATELWRNATGKHDILPDLGDLLAWLLERIATVEKERNL